MNIQPYIQNIHLQEKDAHKGQNGRLLVIGGSSLFHVASAWSLDIASRMVDLVLYSSVVENNEYIREAKHKFWNGIVVPRGEIEQYIQEADCILIGPGMMRNEQYPRKTVSQILAMKHDDIDWENDTYAITNYLLSHYSDKRWVVDAGALQMMEPSLCTQSMILTPHQKEFEMVFHVQPNEQTVKEISNTHGNPIILVKGVEDIITDGKRSEIVSGGNEGMTKGGTGDVLAGIVASLYCLNDAFSSAVVGSYINKKAGESLYPNVGPFFNASDLIDAVAKTLKSELYK